MGKHYGDLLYKTGEDLSSVIKLSDKQKSFGQRCLPIYEKYMSEIMTEVRGLAEGLHQKYEDLAYWLFNIYYNEEEHGCTVFAVKSKDKVALMCMVEETKEILRNTKSGISSISQGSQSISYDSTVQAFKVNESVKALLPKPSIRLF